MNENQIPKIVQDLIETARTKSGPRFQRDLAVQTLERIQTAVNAALNVYHNDTEKKRV